MSFAWRRDVAHLGFAKQKWLHQCEWVLYRGWKKKGGMTFKARRWPDLRIHPMPVTCFIILLGSVLGTNQIIKS